MDAISDGIMVDFSKPTIFFWPNSVSQYASIEPTMPPTPTITTSASVGNFEDFIATHFCYQEYLQYKLCEYNCPSIIS